MTLSFQPIQNHAEIKENVIINGKIVGVIFPCPFESKNKFQAQLHLSNNIYPGGFGTTKKEAVKAAIIKGHEIAATLIKELDALSADLKINNQGE